MQNILIQQVRCIGRPKCHTFLLKAMWIQYDIITHEDKISFWWKDANSCEVNEDVPQGKKGEADEEAQGTTFHKTIKKKIVLFTIDFFI